MINNLTGFSKLNFSDTSIYINPEGPDWFVPAKKTGEILELLSKSDNIQCAVSDYCCINNENTHHVLNEANKILNRINGKRYDEYRGRSNYKNLKELKECWFHITNRCNMSCGHCMFVSDERKNLALDYDDLLHSVYEAMDLGCRVFYFTGGEPFIYQGFTAICDEIMRTEGTHVVILTNGKNISFYNEWLKNTDRNRVHFQLSIDGLKRNHEELRGKGSFGQLIESLDYLTGMGFPVNLAMSVNRNNVQEMKSVVRLASKHDVKNIHFMWLFLKGKAGKKLFAEPEIIFENLLEAYDFGKKAGVTIDNFEIMKSQVYSIPGTRYDLSNSGWESIAVGPDGNIYPSPALIFEEDLAAGHISEGIEQVWKNSKIMNDLRSLSLVHEKSMKNNPLKYIVGGGDIDHSYIYGGRFLGKDPYMKLYESMAVFLMKELAGEYDLNDRYGLLCRMGEKLYECSDDSSAVEFTHSNCVLTLPGKDGYSIAGSFYSEAAEEVNEEIANPVHYDDSEISFIPEEARVRSYGCGSPVMECDLKKGDSLLDLGSGTGVECFIASSKVGKEGAVYGLDMLDNMIELASKSKMKVSENLGYDNIEFKKGHLENLPFKSGIIDVVISNCVINLSPDKRKTLSEARRVLKPGGRLCISDIVCEEDIPVDIKYDGKLRGECLGGAMQQNELFSLLEDLGFENIYVVKRFLYRQVRGFNFYSITYKASKKHETAGRKIIYRGPFRSVTTDRGDIIRRGEVSNVELSESLELDSSFFELDDDGNVSNIEQEISCACFNTENTSDNTVKPDSEHLTGCLVCGEEIVYLDEQEKAVCHYCRSEYYTNSKCAGGHFVCDNCHSTDAVEVIKKICKESRYGDMIELFKTLKSHKAVRMHGPEHHPMVTAVILSVYRNVGGNISDKDILAGIERGRAIPGGACAFMGCCGAAIGAGSAFSVMMNSNPYKGTERQKVQKITGIILDRIASLEAPRCCQRDCWIALKEASALSEEYLGIKLPAESELICEQYALNKECIGSLCPLFKRKEAAKEI